MRYAAHGNFSSCEEVIAAANSGNQTALCAVQALSRHLAMGCASIVNLLDPELLILAGGLAQNNPHLVKTFREELAKRVTVWPERKLRIEASGLGYSAGVLGAAAVAAAAAGEGCSVSDGSSPSGKDTLPSSQRSVAKTSG
jgi:glucokinase